MAVIRHADGKRFTGNWGLQMLVTKGCNLKCPQCAYHGHTLKGVTSVEEFVAYSEAWVKRVVPSHIIILGGEPTLHPDLVGILREAKRIWRECPLGVWFQSNGTMPHRFTDDVLKELKGCHTLISVKPYTEMFGQDKFSDKVRETFRKCWIAGIPLYVRNNALGEWYDFPKEEPCYDTEKAFSICKCQYDLFTIDVDGLYQCAPVYCRKILKSMGVIDWKGLDDFHPLPPDVNDVDLKALLERKFSHAFCKWCWDTPRGQAYGINPTFPDTRKHRNTFFRLDANTIKEWI